jgi:rhodanese-related sulfurtransferase
MAFETIRAKDIEAYIGRKDLAIIDLSNQTEYRRGHIPTAINIPYEEFEQRKKELSFYNELILYCDRGNLSLLLARDLSKEGYPVKNIHGGISAYRGRLIKGYN